LTPAFCYQEKPELFDNFDNCVVRLKKMTWCPMLLLILRNM
jgi:hypothetical protein